MLERILNNKKMLIAILIAMALIIAAIVVVVVVSNPDDTPDVIMPNECEHYGGTATCTQQAICKYCNKPYGDLLQHYYVMGICNACQAVDPDYVAPDNPNKPEKPEIPENVTVGDVDLATKMWNAIIRNTALFYPSDFQVGYDVTNLTFSNPEVAFDRYSYASKNNIDFTSKTIGGKLNTEYKLYKEVNPYIVTYNGVKYNYASFVPVTPDLASLNITNISYDAKTNEYVLSKTYSTNFVNEIIKYVYYNQDNPLGVFDQSLHSDLVYEIRFALTAHYDLKSMSIIGSTSNNIAVCNFNYVRDVNDQTVFTLTYARDNRRIGKTVELERTGNGIYNIIVSENIYESLMAAPYAHTFTGTITFSDRPIDMDNEIINIMSKAETMLENYNKIAEEYAGPFIPEDYLTCNKLAVYDGYYEVLIYLQKQEFEVMGVPLYRYTFDHIELETDNETCWVNVTADGRLTIDRHCEQERLAETIEEKYKSQYACLDGCESVVVYDVEYNVYVVFEQSLGETYLYEYSDYFVSYDMAVDCLGVMDGNNNIVVSHHAQLEGLCKEYADYALLGVTDCEAFSIYHQESKYYMVYYINGNGFEYVGPAPFQIGCLAIADQSSHTIRILTHIEHDEDF